MRHYCDTPGDKPNSSGAPILRPSFYDEAISRGPIYVCGGLAYHKGNPLPYFTLTLSAKDAGGCMHDAILARFPELASLAALHLSDVDGVPMHAAANGLYWLLGYAGGMGERYHGGSGSSAKTADECLRIWSEHVRVPLDTARSIADRMIASARDLARAKGYRVEAHVVEALRAERHALQGLHSAFVDEQRPRWQREADACMNALGIRFYHGDRWPEEASRCGHETVLAHEGVAGCLDCGRDLSAP